MAEPIADKNRKQEIIKIAQFAKNILDTEVKMRSMEADKAMLISQTTINIRNKMEDCLEKLILIIEKEK